MPSKYSLFKSNRSQASLQISQDSRSQHASPIDTPLQSPAFPPPALGFSTSYGEQQDLHRPDAPHYYQSAIPARSQSQRVPSSNYTGQPTIHLVRPPHSSAESPSFDEDDPHSFYQTPVSNNAKGEQESKRSKRSFFGIGHSSKETSPTNVQQPSKSLGRSVSVRRKAPIRLGLDDQQHNQHQWAGDQNVNPRLTPSSHEEEGGARLDRFLQETAKPITSTPANGPLRSPIFPPSPPHTDTPMRGPSQRVNTDSTGRHSFQRKDEYESPQRETGPAQPPPYQRDLAHPSTQQSQYPTFQPPPQTVSNTYQPVQSQRPDIRSQHSFQHPQDNQRMRPPSQQSYEPPSPSISYKPYEPQSEPPQQRASVQQGPSSQYTQGSMAPPPGQAPQARRSSEANLHGQSGPPQGGQHPPSYGQSQGQNPPPSITTGQYSGPPPTSNQQGGNYRGPPASQASVSQQNLGEQGRDTPPPGKSRDDVGGLDVAQLHARYDELQAKYSKVKKYYFDKDAQVQQLQNTLAHQRLAQSRTSLDDNEYATRFNRLDGAINNLAFNIRKEWRTIPPWLQPHVNKDAHTTGTKEMTAVGRACITRWIVDEIFDRYFHPALAPGLSSQLKMIEKNIRRFAPPTISDEEKDALLSKISNWRLTTLDGLQETLASPQATQHRLQLTDELVENLTARLQMHLKEPPPPDLEGGVAMIVELAVGIAANLPLESRDVYVEYFLPGAPVNPEYMKVESALPALSNPGSGSEGMLLDAADKVSLASTEGGDVVAKDDQQNQNQNTQQAASAPASKDPDSNGLKDQQQQQKKKGMFGGFINKKPAAGGVEGGASSGRSSIGNPAGLQQQQQQSGSGSSGGSGGGQKEERVRFAAFMAVEVRGRSILVKAPVYV